MYIRLYDVPCSRLVLLFRVEDCMIEMIKEGVEL